MPDLPLALRMVYQLHYKNDSQPMYSELKDLFLATIQQFDSVFLVLDALDECTLDQRKTLCEFVLAMITPSATAPAVQSMNRTLVQTTSNETSQRPRGILKLFITSRKESDLERAFLQNSVPTIEMEAEKVDRDIEDYVKAQIEQRLQDGDLVLKNMALKEKILTALTKKAGGMYVISSGFLNPEIF